MKNNKKKGFTLVELLVVIAILAILATVSILGYTSFTGKAKASNAEQELAQIKTMFLADWLDGFVGESAATNPISISKETDGYKIKNDVYAGTLKAELDDSATGMKTKIYFVVTAGTGENADYNFITSVVYVQGNGYTATWNISTDKIEAVAGSNVPTSPLAETAPTA